MNEIIECDICDEPAVTKAFVSIHSEAGWLFYCQIHKNWAEEEYGIMDEKSVNQ